MVEQDGGRQAEEGTPCLGLGEAWVRDHRHSYPRTLTPAEENGYRAGVAAGAEGTAGGGNGVVKVSASALTEGRTTVAMGWQWDQRI